MIEDGLNRVVCSKCGKNYLVYKNGIFFDPKYCPSCGWKIKELIVPVDGSRIIAKLENNEK